MVSCIFAFSLTFVTNNFQGGRQIDGAIPSLYALDNICQSPVISEAQKSGKLTVLFDSGIRTGSDIMKAMALGAQGVLRECLIPAFCEAYLSWVLQLDVLGCTVL
jgi:glutamate synthase domain-containing protein 2